MQIAIWARKLSTTLFSPSLMMHSLVQECGGWGKEMGPTFDQCDSSISNPLLHYETIHTWGPVTLLACSQYHSSLL